MRSWQGFETGHILFMYTFYRGDTGKSKCPLIYVLRGDRDLFVGSLSYSPQLTKFGHISGRGLAGHVH